MSIGVLVYVALGLALPIFATGHRIARWEGALLLACSAAYVTFLIPAANQHAALSSKHEQQT